MLHILWETLTMISSIRLKEGKIKDMTAVKENWGVLLCHVCVCFSIAGGHRWTSVHNDGALIPSLSLHCLLSYRLWVYAPLRHIPQSSEAKSLLFCRDERWHSYIYTHLTNTHTRVHTVQSTFHKDTPCEVEVWPIFFRFLNLFFHSDIFVQHFF